MISSSVPENEAARLEALYQYNILDTPVDPQLDDITELAAHLCETPIALIGLVDRTRQWFKSKIGWDITETDRAWAFCHYTIQQSDVFIVPDACKDERFVNNPLVTADPNIRFYAGVPLLTQSGFAIGTLCVIDRVPRQLSAKQTKAMQTLARQVMLRLESTSNSVRLEANSIQETENWQEALLRAMASISPLAFYVVDSRTQEVLYFNHHFCQIWQLEHLEAQMQQGELKNTDILPLCLAQIADVAAYLTTCKPLQDQSNCVVIEDEIRLIDGRTIRRFTKQVRDEQDQYFGRLFLFEDISDRKQTEAALRQQIERERLTTGLTQRIRQSLDLNTIFSTAVSAIGASLQLAYVDIAQYLPEEQHWLHVACYSQNPDLLPSCVGCCIPDANNPIATQLKQLEIVVLTNQVITNSAHPILSQVSVGECLLVPLQARSRTIDESSSTVWGRLMLYKHQSSTWQLSEIELARAIADQLAIAIQQSELYQQVQQLNTNLEHQVQERTVELQRALEFESLLKRVTDKVRDSLDERHILQTAVQELAIGLEVSACHAAWYDLEQGTVNVGYEYLRAESRSVRGMQVNLDQLPEVHDQILQRQYVQFCSITQPLWAAYDLNDPLATLGCPLMDDQGVFGSLWLFKSQQDAFNDLEIRLVQQVANQCAIAIRQARLYQAAQVQIEELERLNRLKDDFLSTVSHELRTPISNIRLATQMLEIVFNQLGLLDGTSRQTARYFQILREECQREIYLINDLLDLARLDANGVPVALTVIDLKPWLSSITASFVERAHNQQQQLQVKVSDNLPSLVTDLSSLERIVSELLNNACKYTPVGETITVSATATLELIQISISNSGVEIAANERDRIFDKFYRIPNSDPWKHGGTGLGLTLVKKLVERLGASISVDSPPNQTVFTVTFPRR